MMRVIVGIVFLWGVNYADVVTKRAIATSESKQLACKKALEYAQQDALHSSGINIFTTYEKTKSMASGTIKEIINSNLQTSFGFIVTKQKNEFVSFNERTGDITCEVEGTFEVDTTGLQTQLIALNEKHNNLYKEEIAKSEAIAKREALTQKYQELKNALLKKHTLAYDESYYCGEILSIAECKTRLTQKMQDKAKADLATQYAVGATHLNLDELHLDATIQVNTQYGLSAHYRGNAIVNVLQVTNPYEDEIKNLSTRITKSEKPAIQSIQTVQPIQKSSIQYNKHMLVFNKNWNTYVDDGFDVDWDNKDDTSSVASVEYLLPIASKYSLKLGVGKATVSRVQTGYTGYDESALGYENKYSYKFYSAGISTALFASKSMRLALDLDYIKPYSVSGTTTEYLYEEDDHWWWEYDVTPTEKQAKIDPFVNVSLNWDFIVADDIVFGLGATKSSQEAWKNNWVVLRLGIVF